MLSIHLRLGLPSDLFPSGFPTNNLYTFLFSPIRATCPAPALNWGGGLLTHQNLKSRITLLQPRTKLAFTYTGLKFVCNPQSVSATVTQCHV
jgi:hypothetical protein